MTFSSAQRGGIQQQQELSSPPLPATARLFSVWMAADIPSNYGSMASMCQAALALVPEGHWDTVELLMKAGEGGTWQAAFDSSPLALRGPIDLLARVQQGLSSGVRIIPYVNVRAQSQWIAGEQLMIHQCVSIAGRCVLNVEPGSGYYNGDLDPSFIRAYLGGIGVRPDGLEVCMIPRAGQVAELGGVACLQAWTDPVLVGRASWETYGLAAGGTGPSSLRPDVAIPRLDGWGVPPGSQYRIIVVQRDDVPNWSATPWAAGGMEVWWAGGN